MTNGKFVVDEDGKRRELEATNFPLTIGRKGGGRDVEFDALTVSRKHAEIRLRDGCLYLVDVGSANGTYHNGKKIPPETEVRIAENDVFRFGSPDGPTIALRAEHSPGRNDQESSDVTQAPATDKTMFVSDLSGLKSEKAFEKDKDSLGKLLEHKAEIWIGRAADCDVRLDSAVVSRKHARVFVQNGAYFVEDAGSVNNTFLNGKPIGGKGPQALSETDAIRIAVYEFRLRSAPKKVGGEIAIRATGVEKKYPGSPKRSLHALDLTIKQGSFVALMGPSGCGKSTLLKALNGDSPATGGRVEILGLELSGDNFETLKREIGYVPQDDIIHRNLTVKESLFYAAKLRLPDDATNAEIQQRIVSVLQKLKLGSDLTRKKVGSLSGGQRKRVSIAVELLAEPKILFLDEPTSPLDPETIDEFLRCIKELTAQGTTVVMVTHKPEDLHYVDDVIFLSAGGYLVYYGPKENLLPYFKAQNIIEIYSAMTEENGKELYQRRLEDHGVTEFHLPPKPIKKRRTESLFRQYRWLSARYLNVKLNDKINMALLVGQPILIGLLLAMIFKHLESGVIFLLAIVSIWFGVSNAAKEIVGEGAIYKRERMYNLSRYTYLFSKLTVLGGIALIQVGIFVGIMVATFDDKNPELQDPLGVLGVMFLLSIAATLLGLFTSAYFDSTEKVMTVVPLLIIPQVMLSGIITQVQSKFVEILSYAILGRWGTEALLDIQGEVYDTLTGLPVHTMLGLRGNAELYNLFDSLGGNLFMIVAQATVLFFLTIKWLGKKDTLTRKK
jgi:ABC-type multidrug transport system ATPase subunit/pSer/pThr/pTyr-binding forkhead associated (FHA) protein